jgi:hypothetical protein
METKHTAENTEASAVEVTRKLSRPRPVYTWFPLTNEERKVIDSASRNPLAWHGYRIIPNETKILRSLALKQIIEFHVTQNLFRILPSALKKF